MAVEFYANGTKIDDTYIKVTGGGGASGSFSAPPMVKYKTGDTVYIEDATGNSIAAGTIISTTYRSTGGEYTFSTSGGGDWIDFDPDMTDWPTSDIIDYFSKQLAERRPA